MQAKKALNEGDIERRTYWINRSSAVLSELINILDYSHGDVAHYLNGLYQHQLHLLLQANMNNSSEKLDEVTSVIKGLLEAWRQTTNVAE
jgi:flagellar protein FliS